MSVPERYNSGYFQYLQGATQEFHEQIGHSIIKYSRLKLLPYQALDSCCRVTRVYPGTGHSAKRIKTWRSKIAGKTCVIVCNDPDILVILSQSQGFAGDRTLGLRACAIGQGVSQAGHLRAKKARVARHCECFMPLGHAMKNGQVIIWPPEPFNQIE